LVVAVVETAAAEAAMGFQEVLEVGLVTGVELLKEPYLLEELAQQVKALMEEAVSTNCQTMVSVEVVALVAQVVMEHLL
jgi:hypothetical protein